MPLPKPPTKRADMLTADDYTSQPKPVKKTSKGTKRTADVPAVAPAVAAPVLELVKVKQAPTQPHIVNDKDAGATATPVAPASNKAKVASPAPTTRKRKPVHTGPAKLFVLDTNVLLHDPMSLYRFEEHDIFLPMITLEELDGHKKGMTEVARNARQVSRELDGLATDNGSHKQLDATEGIQLAKTGHVEAGGKLYFQTTAMVVQLPMGLPQGKADNQILGVVQALRDQFPDREVVLVSKDINMRIKARAMGLPAEDYFNDKTLEDGDLLYTGVMALPADFWERHAKGMESWTQ
ncbi:MAG: PhoH family protein, partial [Aquabacterium sp.]|nr:PhoH family protein [Aquabacterium sp.]